MGKKSSKPHPPQTPAINPQTRTINIEHMIGDKSFLQKLTLPRKRPFTNIYQFKCSLLETNPLIWRRIQVPESYTFYDLHVAIQDAMDWQDYHLHHFEVPDQERKGTRVHIECPWWDPWDMENDWLITTEVFIKDFFKQPSIEALYRYDYGDSWEMSVRLEKISPKKKNTIYPICQDGELAAPPEDCGGIPGYDRCFEAFVSADELDLITDPYEKEEIENILEWLGDWGPITFNPELIVFDDPRERFIKALELE